MFSRLRLAQGVAVAHGARVHERPSVTISARKESIARSSTLVDKPPVPPYRDYLRKKQEQAAGPPILRKATRAQVQPAIQVKREQKRGLTA